MRLAYISTAIDRVFHFAARNDFTSVQCLLSRTCPLHVEVSFHSVMEQDADIRENLYVNIVLSARVRQRDLDGEACFLYFIRAVIFSCQRACMRQGNVWNQLSTRVSLATRWMLSRTAR